MAASFFTFLGFLLLGASMILQLLVALSLPYIKRIFFLSANLGGSQAIQGGRITFGIWTNCIQISRAAVISCDATSLGYKGQTLRAVTEAAFQTKGLVYALVAQPASAGIVGAAAGGAFLALCLSHVIWPTIAGLAVFLTAGTLAIELATFILAKRRLDSSLFASSTTAPGGYTIGSTAYGPALWMQCGALAAALIGFLLLSVGFAKKNREEIFDKQVQYDFEPASASAGNMTAAPIVDDGYVGYGYGADRSNTRRSLSTRRSEGQYGRRNHRSAHYYPDEEEEAIGADDSYDEGYDRRSARRGGAASASRRRRDEEREEEKAAATATEDQDSYYSRGGTDQQHHQQSPLPAGGGGGRGGQYYNHSNLSASQAGSRRAVSPVITPGPQAHRSGRNRRYSGSGAYYD